MKCICGHGISSHIQDGGPCTSCRCAVYADPHLDAKQAINHPAHYGGADNIYEAIKVIEAWQLDFCLGNTVKYISRAGKKDPEKLLEDLSKAKWYLDRKITQLKASK